MRQFAPLVSIAGLVVLAACTPQQTARPEPAAAAPAATGSDACGASKVTSYTGRQRTDEVIAKIKSASGAQALRVVGPNDVMTMDFREDRLTITTDEQGRIKTLRCV